MYNDNPFRLKLSRPINEESMPHLAAAEKAAEEAAESNMPPEQARTHISIAVSRHLISKGHDKRGFGEEGVQAVRHGLDVYKEKMGMVDLSRRIDEMRGPVLNESRQKRTFSGLPRSRDGNWPDLYAEAQEQRHHAAELDALAERYKDHPEAAAHLRKIAEVKHNLANLTLTGMAHEVLRKLYT